LSVLCFVVVCAGEPPRFAVFPYTTLFRSDGASIDEGTQIDDPELSHVAGILSSERCVVARVPGRGVGARHHPRPLHEGADVGLRSEEHTSELQSRENLVCRLLLEKNKNKT